MEAFKKILRTPTAFVLFLVAIFSLLGTVIKSKSDENIARIPVDATSTAEAKLTQIASTVFPTHIIDITETIAPVESPTSVPLTTKTDPVILLTQSADSYNKNMEDNPDLNPELLIFPVISIQDSAVRSESIPRGWSKNDPIYDHTSSFRDAGSAEKFSVMGSMTAIDPPFDIIILNTTNNPIFVTHVGVEIIKVSFMIRGGGGDFPHSEKVEIQDEYELELPDINGRHKYEGGGYEQYENLLLDQVVSLKLTNPIYMQPQAPYRFVLTLRDYVLRMPTDVYLRFWVKTNIGESRSRIIFLFTPKGSNMEPIK